MSTDTTNTHSQEIAAAVERVGGHVVYEAEFDGYFASDRFRTHDEQRKRGGPISLVILDGPDIDDQTIAELAPSLSKIPALGLLVDNITDAGLSDLHLLRNAKRIQITSPNVTDNAMSQLRKALPNTIVER